MRRERHPSPAGTTGRRHRPSTGHRRGTRVAGGLAIAALAVLLACGGDGEATGSEGGDGSSQRQEEVAERGAEVMPFDLETTTHHFEPTPDGLVQTVVADDPGDQEQVALIQEHVSSEAERFRGGDYRDPSAIHGESMPGLRELEAGTGAITIDYQPIAEGGRLVFRTDDPALVDALHRWGEAQTRDHGRHAR